MDGIYLMVVMIVTGGAIAFIGDKLGTKIGKKRLSIFGLRPRHTSMVITIITGALITGLSIGTMAVMSKNVRTALFGMEELNAAMASTKASLNEATNDLLKMHEEFEKADAALGNAREEIEKMKVEQQELNDESERLKIGNERLEAEKFELTTQNENLANMNKNLSDMNENLEIDNKKLSEFNVTLTSDNEKLNKDNAELEERAKNLREGLIAVREGDIVFRAGEILASDVIKSNRTPEEIAEDMNIIADTASRNIAERFGDGTDSSVWIYQPEFQQAVEDIAASGTDVVFRITAAGNLVRGEPIRTRITMFPNDLIYKADEQIFVGEYEVKSEDDAEQIVQSFLGDINKVAVAKGILPDPITGSVGVMEGDQLYGLIEELEAVKGRIRLRAAARADTYSIGPLRLSLQIQQEVKH